MPSNGVYGDFTQPASGVHRAIASGGLVTIDIARVVSIIMHKVEKRKHGSTLQASSEDGKITVGTYINRGCCLATVLSKIQKIMKYNKLVNT